MATQEKEAVEKIRNFATIVYPESAPEGWMTWLRNSGNRGYISPLHNPDGEEGGEKKPHYHVMIMFNGPQRKTAAESIVRQIGGVGIEKITNREGYSRYLSHLDNPEKEQLNIQDVVEFGGAKYLDDIGGEGCKLSGLVEVLDFVERNNITSYATLVKYCLRYNPLWFSVLIGREGYVIKEYLYSRTKLSPEENQYMEGEIDRIHNCEEARTQ